MNLWVSGFCTTDRKLVVNSIKSFFKKRIPAAKFFTEIRGDCFLVNANFDDLNVIEQSGSFKGGDLYSFTSLPIPTQDFISEDSYLDTLESIISGKRINELLPGFAGAVLSYDGDLKVFNDFLGLARCYETSNAEGHFFSNHIEVLAHLSNSKPDIDSINMFGSLEWFGADTTPYKDVFRVKPSSYYSYSSKDKTLENSQYTSFLEVIDHKGLNYHELLDSCAHELKLVMHNFNVLSKNATTLHLSGGRDSRLTAAIALSQHDSVGNFNVMTNGKIEGEAIIARRLMQHFPCVHHNVVYPNSSSSMQDAQSPSRIHERLLNRFHVYSGDYIFGSINASATAGMKPVNSYKVGGAGGEIPHGFYYSSQKKMQRALSSIDFELILKSSRIQSVSKAQVGAFFNSQLALANDSGVTEYFGSNFIFYDWFYLNERFRRWAAQCHNTNSLLLYSSPSFVRLSFNASHEFKITKKIHSDLVAIIMPEWSDVPFYSGFSNAESNVPERYTLLSGEDISFYRHAIDMERSCELSAFDLDFLDSIVLQTKITNKEHKNLNKIAWVSYLKNYV